MQTGDRQVRLSSMVALAPNRIEQKRAAGNGLQTRLGIGQAHKPTPPVVDQCHVLGGEPTAMQVVRGVTTPAPLILQLIEAILAVSAVAVELRHRELDSVKQEVRCTDNH